MKHGRSPAPIAIGLTLAGVLGLGVGEPAWADRGVALSFQDKPDAARIIAKWSDGDDKAPKIQASVSSQVLILTFDQKVKLDLDALQKNLPDWAALTRMDPDGMTARIGLKQGAKVHISTSADLIAIDLKPEQSPAAFPGDVVSPLVAKKTIDAEKARKASLPPPPPVEALEVRGSQNGNSSRVAFYWQQKVNYKVLSRTPGELKLLFVRQAKPDLAYLHIYPPANLANFEGENTDKGYLVTLSSKDQLPIKDFYDNDVLVLDITRPDPEAAAAAAGQAAKTAAAKPPQAAASANATPKAGEVTDSRTKAATQPAVQPVAAKVETKDKPSLLAPPTAPPDAGALAREAAAAAATAEAAAHDALLGGPERKTAMASSWKDPAPHNGVVEVKVLPLSSGVELQATFAQTAPAAVFSRGNAVWAVFAANADLKVDPTALPIGFKVRVQRSKDATMLRLEVPKGLTVSADAADATWVIRLAPTATKPHRFLQPQRTAGKDGRSQIETMLPQAAGIIWFEDPVVGDQIAALVSYAPSSASTTPRDFIEASLPATAHGLAIIPKSDDAVVTLASEKAVVSLPGRGQTVPEAAPTGSKLAVVSANPAFIDFSLWGAQKGETWYKQRAKLEAAVSEADGSSPQGSSALLDLARFYIGHEMSYEALGVLQLAANQRSEIEQDAQFLGMRGAANVMAHRLKAGEDDLSKGPLRSDPSAALWRGLIAVDMKQWERAADFFHQGGDQVRTYSPAWAAHFMAAEAEAALNTNDYDAARRFANEAISLGKKGDDADQAKLVLAELADTIDGPAKAYDQFEQLSKSAAEPIAVRADLRRLQIGVAANKMTAEAAAQELEALRFRWRGDDVEMATVGILADQYMSTGRFREALALAQSAALRDPTAPGARDLRIRLTDYFRRLFLNGEVDRLDPIQALGLFYEFKELMPVGVDGDQMIRKMAQRLVAFDLLGPAAELLQYQVDNRLNGVSQSAVAVDLAKIYLWDKRPDKALAAINSTRQPQLPKDLALERRLLEAAAYRDLGRYDHTIELVEPLEGLEAKSLLADAYWRSRQWPEAAKTFVSMLPAPKDAKSDQAPVALRAAIAARMAKDNAMLADLRSKYLPVFEKPGDKASFELITAQTDLSGSAVAEAVKRLADAPEVDAFAAAMKARFEADRKEIADEAAKQKAAADKAAAEKAAEEKAAKAAAVAKAAAKAAEEKAAADAAKKAGGKDDKGGKNGDGKAADAKGDGKPGKEG